MLWWAAIHISIWLFIKQQKRLGLSFLLSSAAGLMLLNHPIHRPVAIGASSQATDNLRELADCTQDHPHFLGPDSRTTMARECIRRLGPECGRNQSSTTRCPGSCKGSLISTSLSKQRTSSTVKFSPFRLPIQRLLQPSWFVVTSIPVERPDKTLSFGHSNHQTGIIWMRPILSEAGPTPIALVHIATPFESGSIYTWHRNIEQSIATIRATTSTIQNHKTIVLGSFAAPQVSINSTKQ